MHVELETSSGMILHEQHPQLRGANHLFVVQDQSNNEHRSSIEECLSQERFLLHVQLNVRIV